MQYPTRNIDFNRVDLEEPDTETLHYSCNVYTDQLFNGKIASFHSYIDSGNFQYSKNNGSYTAIPTSGIPKDGSIRVRFLYDSGYFSVPHYVQGTNLVKASIQMTDELEVQKFGHKQPNSISVDQSNGNVWASTDNGDLYNFWGDPLRLKKSYKFDSGLLASRVDGKRKLIWLIYQNKVIIADTDGQYVTEQPLDGSYSEVLCSHIDPPSGGLFIGGEESEFVLPTTGTSSISSYTATSVGVGEDDFLLVTLDNSDSIYKYEINSNTYSLYLSLPGSEDNARLTSFGDEMYLVKNVEKKIAAYEGLSLKWEIDMPLVYEDEIFEIKANWNTGQQGRMIYIYSKKSIISAQDTESTGKIICQKALPPGNKCSLDIGYPENNPHIWTQILPSSGTDNYPVIIKQPPSYEFFVESDLNEWQGDFILENGVVYLLEITGSHAYYRREVLNEGICAGVSNYNGYTHDAIYRYSVPSVESGNCGDSLPDTHSNLKISTGTTDTTADSIYSGSFNSSHEYSVFVTGEGLALNVKFDDTVSDYLDNIGGCTIKVYKYLQ